VQEAKKKTERGHVNSENTVQGKKKINAERQGRLGGKLDVGTTNKEREVWGGPPTNRRKKTGTRISGGSKRKKLG